MIANKDLKRYNKKNSYSYTFGAFPTFELLKNRPEQVEKVLIHTTVKEEIYNKIHHICNQTNIPLIVNDGLIGKIRDKESSLVIGVFYKYSCYPEHHKNHVVLVNPSDTGNLGTIMRTSVGFGINNLAIIEPSVDIFNPKTVRASMGALFHMKFQCFASFNDYYNEYEADRTMYPFMLKGTKKLGHFQMDTKTNFSLIFGNESSGLDDSFLEVGESVLIPHSSNVDSLNLSLATGIAIYEFTKHNFV